MSEEEDGVKVTKIDVHDDQPTLDTADVPTEWETVRKCGCDFAVITKEEGSTRRYFWRGWEVDSMVITVIILEVFCLSMYWAGTFIGLTTLHKIISALEIHVFFILFKWCYFSAMCMDPGFLPYNWSKTKRSWYSWQEQLTHLAVKEAQFEYAENHEKPLRSSFSKSAGRFVLRADHICGWICNWVGKRNHKQFILMGFYGGIAVCSMVVWRFFTVVSTSERSKVIHVLEIIANIIEGFFGLTLFGVCIEHLQNTWHNQTQLDTWKSSKTPPADCSNFKEICGENYWCLLCPKPAFEKDLMLESPL